MSPSRDQSSGPQAQGSRLPLRLRHPGGLGQLCLRLIRSGRLCLLWQLGRLAEVVIGSVALALRSLGMEVKCGSSEGLCLLSRDQRS